MGKDIKNNWKQHYEFTDNKPATIFNLSDFGHKKV